MNDDPRQGPLSYCHDFRNVTAYSYAEEAIEAGDLTDETLEDWAFETAESLSAVIYTAQAAALWAAGVLDDEEPEMVAAVLSDDSIDPLSRMDRAVEVLSLEWHRRALEVAAQQSLRTEEEAK